MNNSININLALTFATIHEQPFPLLYCGINTEETLKKLPNPQGSVNGCARMVAKASPTST
jgi:hypothetical protein